jgi:hypothetical protein|tara:strand:- start:1320 stop:1577 length:258 start_codon:yes stop_codon:yes gene_type:complete
MNFLYIRKLLLEAVCVGVLVVVIGSLMGFSLSKFYPRPEMPEECGNYNKFFIMEATLFLTGFILHLLCEVSGVNVWYLKNSAAAL